MASERSRINVTEYEYQYGFSQQNPEVLDVESRRRKAKSALAVFRHAGLDALETRALLNVGASSGAMDAVFAQVFGEVVGIDIDEHAIALAQKNHLRENLTFRIADALNIPYPSDSFDVVICSQVYEHVPDQPRLFAEIHRVLKPGGFCYFAATNRLVLIEPHYRLPLLSWLPRPLANFYLRVLRRGDRYYERMHGLAELRRLTAAFRVVDFTLPMLADPQRYAIEYMLQPHSMKQRIALLMARRLPWLFQGYIWLLYKTRPSEA